MGDDGRDDGPTDVTICVDVGSTFTKASLVDLTQGRIVAAAEHPTTLPDASGVGDVLDAYDACLAGLVAADPRAADAPVLACSSAGGGLRIVVIGNEELVTAEAGRRVALSSGGKVVGVVAAGGVEGRGPQPALYRDLRHSARPDVVLLTGGTDGGNSDVLLQAARDLVASGWTGPVVVAGNVDAAAEVTEVLAHVPHVVADNVVPRIGVLEPAGARAAIREVFLSHVIGGKHLSSRTTARGESFTAMVRGATPDVVLTGVELLAHGLDGQHPGAGDVVVVEVDPEDAGLAREVVAPTSVTRTVEGDLGMRWSATTTLEAAGTTDQQLLAAARRRTEDPGFLPTTDADHDDDEAIARAAIGLALRRHAGHSTVVVGPTGRLVERSGKDLREVDLLVGSGGVLRHGREGVSDRVLAGSVGPDLEGGWQLPERARVVVDTAYVLAAVGLLAGTHPEAAHRLARRLVEPSADLV